MKVGVSRSSLSNLFWFSNSKHNLWTLWQWSWYYTNHNNALFSRGDPSKLPYICIKFDPLNLPPNPVTVTIIYIFSREFREQKTVKLYLPLLLAGELMQLIPTHLANGPWNKSLNFIFPTKYVIPKSLKFSHWPSRRPFNDPVFDFNINTPPKRLWQGWHPTPVGSYHLDGQNPYDIPLNPGLVNRDPYKLFCC